ncbi:MAG TPA: tripartite tricarboxylate transporter substrate binding protein [Burkholderiales bacterium]|nr:tripartite tricarboxylate transporter substrate binding protein [Burkholderiales bacterium]
MKRFLHFSMALCLSVLPALAVAQAERSYPQKAIKIIVPFPPGGTSDILGRVLSERLSDAWGQPVIVENRGGGGGSIGMDAVRKASPDGYTLALANQFIVTTSVLNKSVSFDVERDFEGVALVATTPLVLIANPSVKAANLRELTDLLRSNPKKFAYASCSLGSPLHFAGEEYKFLAKVSMLHSPYRGCAPAVVDVIAGQVQLGVVTLGSALPHVKSGKLKAIATTGAQRASAAPEIPTFRESGVQGLESYELDSWYGILAPAGTPPEVLNVLTPEVMKIMQQPDVQTKLSAAGFDRLIGDGKQLVKIINDDFSNFRRIARVAHISLE